MEQAHLWEHFMSLLQIQDSLVEMDSKYVQLQLATEQWIGIMS